MPFQVKITGSLENPGIQVTGEEFHPIKPEDYEIFGLDIERMKTHYERGWGIGRPKSIYLKSADLPWGDQSYAKYGLKDVTMRRRCISSRLVSIDTEPFIALGLPARNASGRRASVHLETSLTVTHGVQSSWNADVRAGSSTTVGVEVGGDAVGGKVSVSQTYSLEAGFGKGGGTTKDETIGSSAGTQVELEPHTGAQAKLSATRGRLVYEAVYEASIEGHIWIDFGRRVKRTPQSGAHAFYFEPVAVAVPVPRKTDRQTMTIDTFANYRIDIEDLALDGPSAEGPA